MEVDARELGKRLRLAREAASLTQEAAATHLNLTRGALAQVEAGMRAPNSLQLVTLARLYGRDPADLLAEEFDANPPTALQALFRAEADIGQDPERAQAVRQCAELRHDFAALEEMLGIEHQGAYPVRYEIPAMRARYEAVRHGEALANSERGRLGLGDEPIPSLVQLLQSQGIWVAEVSLPDNTSGFTLHDPAEGIAIFVNGAHHHRRRRFSYAHEYCHAVADWQSPSVVSKQEERAEFREVRANAFAAAFLLPVGGVREYVASLGKGRSDRALRVFDEEGALTARERSEPRSRAIGAHDVALLANAFGTSYDAAAYRLQNLGLVTNDERESLASQRDLANAFRSLKNEPAEPEGADFHMRLIHLAIEAVKAELISSGRFRELCLRAGLGVEELDELVFSLSSKADPKVREAPIESALIGA